MTTPDALPPLSDEQRERIRGKLMAIVRERNKGIMSEDDVAPLRQDETDYTCPQCHADTNFEDESNLMRRWDFRGFLGERDWLELWRCPVCDKKYILRNGD